MKQKTSDSYQAAQISNTLRLNPKTQQTQQPPYSTQFHNALPKNSPANPTKTVQKTDPNRMARINLINLWGTPEPLPWYFLQYFPLFFSFAHHGGSWRDVGGSYAQGDRNHDAKCLGKLMKVFVDWWRVVVLLMEEILHHLPCMKPCK